MQTTTYAYSGTHSTRSGVSLKKLRKIADGLNGVYQRAGGSAAVEFQLENIRGAIGDSVGTAFQAIEQLESNEVPSYLLGLLPDDEAAFELRCRHQPPVDPTDPEAAPTMVSAAVDIAAQHRHGHCPGCNYRFTVPGESCPNCDPDDDDQPLALPAQPTRKPHAPEPAEGFQFCPHCGGEVPRSGGTCPGCERYIDAVYVSEFRPEDMD